MTKKKIKKFVPGIGAILMAMTFVFGANANIISASAKAFLPDQGEAAFAPKYETLNDAKAAGNKLNEEITKEGTILLKNKDNAFPLDESERKVSIFGIGSVRWLQGGSGSGSGVDPYQSVTIKKAFEEAGFSVNPSLYSFYQNKYKEKENGQAISNPVNVKAEPIFKPSEYTAAIQNSYKDYSDVAVIVISRTGREDFDLDMRYEQINGEWKHLLEPTDDELAILDHVKNAKDSNGNPLFKKIMLLVNTGSIFEVTQYLDDDRVQGIMYTGFTGSTGVRSIPKIMTGEINPSGKTVDAWPADFTTDPSWYNVGDNKQVGGTTQNLGTGPDGKDLAVSVTSVDYEEGIYVGYKWYETAATIDGYFNTDAQYKDPAHPDDPYYNRQNGAAFPFGYGLSYTQFDWEIGEPSLSGDINAEYAATEVTIPVKVTNIGSVSGKDVVQMYLRGYYDEELAPIEKSDVSFLGFQKTEMLAPGESQTVTLKFNIRDLASFDWDDINKNGFKGYEIEEGNYEVLFRTDSHTDKNPGFKVDYNVTETIKYSEDGIDNPLNYNMGFGEETAKPWFSQENEWNISRVGAINENGDHFTEEDAKYVSRSNWYLPEPSTDAERTYTQAAVDLTFKHVYYAAAYDTPEDPWYVENVPEGWKQAPDDSDPDRVAPIQLKDMTGVPLDDPKWVEFMNQLTWAEMTYMICNSRYQNMAVKSIGKPYTRHADGPLQLKDVFNDSQLAGTFFCSAPVISATYNTELAYSQGEHIAVEGMLMNWTEDDGQTSYVGGWYGPGMNTHRTPFCGRNFEYYSQDGIQGGIIAASVVRGATDNGMIVYGKHYVANDMETDRKSNCGISVWATEQSMREIYFRQFQYAIQYGNMNAVMNSHGKLGIHITENHYYLNVYMPRNEWGFNGIFMTDMVDGAAVTDGRALMDNGDMLARNGGTFLGTVTNQDKANADPLYSDGRVMEGYYDEEKNMIMVPDDLVISETWHSNYDPDKTYSNNKARQGIYYNADSVTASKTVEASPTQWFAVRDTATRILYVIANSSQMQSVEGNTAVGAYVDIHFNDGVTEDYGYIVNKGDTIEEPALPVIPEGKRFAGWFIDEECTQLMDFSKPVTKYTALYASIIDANQYIVTFNPNYDGAITGGTIAINIGDRMTDPPYPPSRAGYKFAGWYLEPECFTSITVNGYVPEADTVFYAKWIPVASYEIIYDLNYDGAVGVIMDNVQEGDLLIAPNISPVREGYKFDGWYRDSYCKAEAKFGEKVEADMTLYAKWTKIESGTDIETNLPEENGNLGTLIAVSAVSVVVTAVICLGVVFIIRRKNTKN